MSYVLVVYCNPASMMLAAWAKHTKGAGPWTGGAWGYWLYPNPLTRDTPSQELQLVLRDTTNSTPFLRQTVRVGWVGSTG